MDGSVECRLISCKSCVTPRKKILIPRIELMGSLMAIRLAKKIWDTFQFQFSEMHFFTDSSAVLGMLHCNSVTFKEFVGNRISEIKNAVMLNSGLGCLLTKTPLTGVLGHISHQLTCRQAASIRRE